MILPILLAAGVVGLVYASRSKASSRGASGAVQLADWNVFFAPKKLIAEGDTMTQADIKRELANVQPGPVGLLMGTLPGHNVSIAQSMGDPLVLKSPTGATVMLTMEGKLLSLSPDKQSGVVELPPGVARLLPGSPNIVQAHIAPSDPKAMGL